MKLVKVEKTGLKFKIVNDDRWITIRGNNGHGRHILIKEDGTVIGGAGGALNGKKLTDIQGVGEVFTNDELQKLLNSDPEAKELYEKLTRWGVEYNPPKVLDKPLETAEIFARIGGLDKTGGSCASLSLAFTAQRFGWDVRDFRGGDSKKFFANSIYFAKICKDAIVKESRGKNEYSVAVSFLKKVLKEPEGKEFIMGIGRHTAVIKRYGNYIDFYELQSSNPRARLLLSGKFKNNYYLGYILKNRFKCYSACIYNPYNYLVDCEKLKDSARFKMALGFINTPEDKQLKVK